MHEHTKASLINCFMVEGLLDKRYRPVCPKCGKESQNTIELFGKGPHKTSLTCRNCMKTYDVEIGYTQSCEDALTYHQGNTFNIDEDYIIAVPDGYKASIEYGGVNDKWVCIVPKFYDLSQNHVDAEPFSIGVSSLNVVDRLIPNPQNFNTDYKQLLIALMLHNGMLDNSQDYSFCDITKDCVAVYQKGIDGPLSTYLKVRGFICAGSNIRMFHFFANYEAPITDIDGEFDYFEKIISEWLKKTVHVGEIKFSSGKFQ